MLDQDRVALISKVQNAIEQIRPYLQKDGGDVDAITAATISSRAFCDAINRAFDAYNEYKGGVEE